MTQKFPIALAAWFVVSLRLGLADNTDDFNDNAKNSAKWGADSILGRGVLTERNQHLEYTVASGPTEDDASRPWILTRFPTGADWQVQYDVVNLTTLSLLSQLNSIGLSVLITRTNSPEIFAELYSSALGSLPSRTGFFTQIEDEHGQEFSVDREGGFGVTRGAIRLAFAQATKVVTISYDTNSIDGYQWTEMATFGLAGSGGAAANANWNLSATEQFSVSIYGYSVLQTVGPGQMFVDNFSETGGVLPSDQPWPDPLGNYKFRFPTQNPLITRIASVTGNYQGISPTRHQRPYSIDLAQDESGKVSALGRIDGIVDKNGRPELTGLSGTVRTVNGEPQGKIKGSFTGARDGIVTTVKGSATVPVELIAVGGGTNEVRGTGTYSSKVGGVPFSGRNLPIAVPTPSGAADQLKQDWSLDLDLERKLIGTKVRTVASARLTLPNGDTLAFRERAVRHSRTKGYTLSFARGTNLTANPVRIDRKSAVVIKGLTFVRQGEDWRPTGGTILYKFLGQRGTANLMDFEQP